MKPFTHYSPVSVSEAAELSAREGRKVRFVAGGTDLLGGLKDSIHPRPAEVLIDLKRIRDLDVLEVGDEGLTIGATLRLRRIETDPAVVESYGLLAAAAKSVASPQLRNMGTIGGNVCQEPRCWYYRYPDNGFHCLRKGGAQCPALTGESRYHSIFGSARVGTPPCTQNCPASVDVPAYMAMLRAGDWDGAAERLLSVNPLPAVTGRVCPHFCQEDCNRGDLDEPVSIRSVERRLGDYILDHAARFMAPPAAETGRSAAVVGAGPAGLACAFYLRRAGHQVTVYDRLDRVGGMLTHAIPAYRLPREVVERIAAALEAMGVVFKLGKDLDLAALNRETEAVFVAIGAWGRPAIGIEGEDLALGGLDFLVGAARGRADSPGRRVVVVGGGNVAVDVGLTARRLGAETVTLVCLESREDMPAHEWEIAQAQEEGLRILPEWGPARIVRSGSGLRVDLVRCTSVFDENGLFCPAYAPEETEDVEADAVFLAVGQTIDLAGLSPDLADRRGRIAVDAFTQAAGAKGVYAGGDAVTGPASVIAAVASGGRAAAAMAQRLGTPLEPRPDEAMGRPLTFDPSALRPNPAAVEAMTPAGQRRLTIEDTATISDDAFRTEAGRCFNCGCVAVSPADLPPALIALGAAIRTDRRVLLAEDFFQAGPAGSTVLEPGEIVTHISVPKPAPDTRWSGEKFRRRRSIDFPIASVAVCLEMDGERVKASRIVLGAVAPTPIRAAGAEAALTGGPVTEETAQAAARAAVENALPLLENEYKIEVVKALVRRNVLAAV